jgi:hypothetical protein
MINGNNELRWQLAGIRAERKQYEDYVQYLSEQEKSLSERLMTGTPTAGTTQTASKPGRKKSTTTNSTTPKLGKRKRVMSDEQRQKMSAAARKRWDNIKGKTNTATTVSGPPPAPPIGEIPGSTVQ